MALAPFVPPQIPLLGSTRQYSASDLIVSVLGNPITEFAKDSKVTFEFADGKVAFLEDLQGGAGVFHDNPSQKGTLKFSLSGVGDDVNTLRAIWAASRASRTLPIGPVALTRQGDIWAIGAAFATMTKFPSMSYGGGADAVEVEFEGVFTFTIKPVSSI